MTLWRDSRCAGRIARSIDQELGSGEVGVQKKLNEQRAIYGPDGERDGCGDNEAHKVDGNPPELHS